MIGFLAEESIVSKMFIRKRNDVFLRVRSPAQKNEAYNNIVD